MSSAPEAPPTGGSHSPTEPKRVERAASGRRFSPSARGQRRPPGQWGWRARRTMRAANRAARARIGGHTRIEVGLVATVTDMPPRGG